MLPGDSGSPPCWPSLRLPAVSPAGADSGATAALGPLSPAAVPPSSHLLWTLLFLQELLWSQGISTQFRVINYCSMSTPVSLTPVSGLTGFFSRASWFILVSSNSDSVMSSGTSCWWGLFFCDSSSATTCLSCPAIFQSSVHLFLLLSLEEKSSFDTLCARFQTRRRWTFGVEGYHRGGVLIDQAVGELKDQLKPDQVSAGRQRQEERQKQTSDGLNTTRRD